MTEAPDDQTSRPWRYVAQAIELAPATTRISVAVRDHSTGCWFQHNESEVFRAASTVKLLILLGLADAVSAGRASLDTLLPIEPEQSVEGSGVLHWLKSVSPMSVHDLAWLMIAISDNTASNVLMDHVSLDRIHALQESLKLHGTALNRHFMKPVPGQPGNTATAHDLVTVLDAIAAHPTQAAWMMGMLADQQVQDRLGRNIPDHVTFAGKSGWQTEISHDSGFITCESQGVTVAVLTEGFDDPHEAAAFIGSVGLAVVQDLGLETDTSSAEGAIA